MGPRTRSARNDNLCCVQDDTMCRELQRQALVDMGERGFDCLSGLVSLESCTAIVEMH